MINGVGQKIFELVCCYDFVKETIDDNKKINIQQLKEKIANEIILPTENEVNNSLKRILNTYNSLINIFTENEIYELWDTFVEIKNNNLGDDK